jgi:DNA-binding NtrC family response regulator
VFATRHVRVVFGGGGQIVQDEIEKKVSRWMVNHGLRASTALRAPDAPHPDLIIVDMYMPEMDGIEFLMHLAEVAPGIPTIATSGGGMINNMLVLDDAAQLGAAALLPEPFTSGDVSRVLEEVLKPVGRPQTDQAPTSKLWPPHP